MLVALFSAYTHSTHIKKGIYTNRRKKLPHASSFWYNNRPWSDIYRETQKLFIGNKKKRPHKQLAGFASQLIELQLYRDFLVTQSRISSGSRSFLRYKSLKTEIENKNVDNMRNDERDSPGGFRERGKKSEIKIAGWFFVRGRERGIDDLPAAGLAWLPRTTTT